MRRAVTGIAWPGIVSTALFGVIGYALLDSRYPELAVVPFTLLLLALLRFRDPDREIPVEPFGIFSPVDGRIVEVEANGKQLRMVIRVAWFGAYSIRSPIEGLVDEDDRQVRSRGLQILSDEGEKVYLRLHGPRWFGAYATVSYGERLGRGNRCGVLRLARAAEIWMPANAQPEVKPGQAVRAGLDLLARLPEEGGH